jgi:hypothetical protein
MLIVWGTKVRMHGLGYVAELCPSCRVATPHRFSEVIHAAHVYYIPAERGKVVGYGVKCAECGDERMATPERFVAMSRKPARIDMLQQATNPGLAAELAELKEREERAQRGEAMPEDRQLAMQEALLFLEEKVQKRADSVHFDARSGLLGLAPLVLPWFLIVPGVARDGTVGSALLYAGLATLCVGLVLFFHALATDVPRFIRTQLAKALQERLRPFDASPTELAELVKSLKASGWTLGKKLDPEWLSAQVYSR